MMLHLHEVILKQNMNLLDLVMSAVGLMVFWGVASDAFRPSGHPHPPRMRMIVHQLRHRQYASPSAALSMTDKTKGDPLRAATGIRPSLHPTTINAIAEALKARSSPSSDVGPLQVTESVTPLDVAMTAGKIASNAIGKRQRASRKDGMELTEEEQQTIAGRVLGVIMRLDDLEVELFDKVSSVEWVRKYNEWATFGVLKDEGGVEVDERITDDPLFCLSRAECLLAIFLRKIEIPSMEKAKRTAPDKSKIDFLDSDRAEVLLSND
jgi:hypothetical protein